MASRTAAIFEFKDVLAPVENTIAGFFEELKQKRPVSPESIRDIEKILINFDADQLLPPDEFDALTQRAQKLQKQLIVVDYLSTHQDAEIYVEIMEVYLKFVNRPPIKFLPPYVSPKKTSNTTLSDQDLENIGMRINQLDQELKPLEAQSSLPMIIPQFESIYEVYAFMVPFQHRSERVVWLNELKDELQLMRRKLSAHLELREAVSGLLARIKTLHAEFSRQPLSLKKVMSGPAALAEEPPAPHAPQTEFFSQKRSNLTLS